jgi:hypothetical protein
LLAKMLAGGSSGHLRRTAQCLAICGDGAYMSLKFLIGR